jgi:exopolysaccharide biosynthesis polyprenyl glycosylphosphotransferase
LVGITHGYVEVGRPVVVHLAARQSQRRHAGTTKALVVAADTAAVATALALGVAAWAARTEPTVAALRTHAGLAALSLPLWLLAVGRAGLYRSRRITTPGDELRRLVHAVVYGGVASAVLPFALGVHAERQWLAFTAVAAFGLLAVERRMVRAAFARQRRRGVGLRPVVVVGGPGEGANICTRLADDPVLGYDVVGVVDPGQASSDDVLGAIQATGANGVVIATTEVPHELSNRLTRELTDHGIHVELSSSLRGIDHRRLTVRSIGEFPFVYVEPVKRQGWRVAAKRTFDLVVAAVGLVLALPVLAVAALAIKLDSPGPVLFRQERVGRHGRLFHVLKLRTMVTDAEARLADVLPLNEADGPLFKITHDPRVTRVGRVLRTLSLDELPQLVNVLRGEMSLVGPRPALAREVAGWSPEAHERLRVKPGVTGMWQVHGRSSTGFDEYVRYDLYYVDNWSLTTDAAILFRTIPAVVLGRGAC